ncbi:PAAR domain-containing protein, partial [Burkholderia sola]|uniref:PAAR domain-containing protein n=1 Tax=Burkholderia sola TaxID=2843302 RepID=UPI00338F8289
DKLEHGGEVTSGSPWTMFMDRPLARKGDNATCDLHGPTVIDGAPTSIPIATRSCSRWTAIDVHVVVD